jgi:uncharacterized membrane protein YphA (DoxX/SURF4 family)
MPSSRGSSWGGAAPVLIRLALGVTFLWAGLAKVLGTMSVGPESAAALANMGATVPKSPAAPGAPITNTPAPSPSASPPPDAVPPATTPGPGQDPMPADKFSTPGDPARPGGSALSGPTPLDYAAQTPVKQVYGLALAIHGAANPPARADGSVPMATWPRTLGSGAWPVRLAYAVVIVELVGGAMVLMGLLTRAWAAALAGVMLGAIWLTQMGPAIQSGNTALGLFPAHAAWDMQAWMPLLWNFALLMMALALVVGGAGRLAIDNALFGHSSPLDDHGD